MFYASKLDIFNYARLGFAIGHEFTHVLDIGAKKIKTDDGKSFYWWTNATQNNYNARTYTLVDFYNNISTKNDSIDARQTLVENTADNGGYRAAYLTMCTRHPSDSGGTYAPYRLRVMGPYMNSVDFGAAYNCPLGSPMNPRTRAW
ncbi:endothelin-converting enzyme homolog isoform X2 [Paramacrobiotus metropolitanus]|uniref:endothelin-converting enzyme homolog isoform X2 n=1 Tax=Paramacrobiotus metropolitanus TaxID=2943436 RepID=UPI002445F5F1|nr:endothelin-converting enzyme homolog isoform X2 [Paramacrobiotus metropolitanus]